MKTKPGAFAILLALVALLFTFVPKTHAATYDTLIVAAADQTAANTFWEDAGAGAGTFTVALVPYPGPANATATNYIASAQFRKYFPVPLDNFVFTFPTAIDLAFTGTSAANTAYVNAWLQSHGLQRQVLNPL